MKMNRYQYGILIALTLSAASSLVYVVKSSPHASRLSPSRLFSGGDEAPPVIRSQGMVGNAYHSHLKLDNQGSFQFGQGKDAIKQDILSHFQADIHETLIEDQGAVRTSYILLSDIAFDAQINGQMASEFAEIIKVDLQKPALITRNRNGLILSLKTESGLQAFSRDMFSAVMRATQYSLPEGELKNNWVIAEEDGAGTYQAQYQYLGREGEAIEFRRERQFFSKLNASVQGNLGNPTIEGKPSGELTMTFDKQKGVMQSIQGEELVSYNDENQQALGSNRQTIDWKLKTVEALASEKIAELRSLSAKGLASNKTYDELREEAYQEQIRSMYEKKLGSSTLDDIMQSFDSIKGQDGKALTEILLKTRALVFLHPEQIRAITDRMVNLPVKSDQFETLTDAILGIGSPEAQEALVDLLDRLKDKPEAMQMLIPGLGFVKDPIPLVEDSLRRLKGSESIESQNMAGLALGILGSQLAKASDEGELHERHQKLTQELLAEAEANPNDLSHQLDVLGNLAAKESIGFIEAAIKNKDGRIRAAAAMALREIPDPSAQRLLTQVLQGDEDQAVRLSAAEALAYARPSQELLKSQSEMLKNDPDHRVRIQLLQNMSKANFVDQARLVSLLEDSAKNDQDEQVRLYASNLLAEYKSH